MIKQLETLHIFAARGVRAAVNLVVSSKFLSVLQLTWERERTEYCHCHDQVVSVERILHITFMWPTGVHVHVLRLFQVLEKIFTDFG